MLKYNEQFKKCPISDYIYVYNQKYEMQLINNTIKIIKNQIELLVWLFMVQTTIVTNTKLLYQLFEELVSNINKGKLDTR